MAIESSIEKSSSASVSSAADAFTTKVATPMPDLGMWYAAMNKMKAMCTNMLTNQAGNETESHFREGAIAWSAIGSGTAAFADSNSRLVFTGTV